MADHGNAHAQREKVLNARTIFMYQNAARARLGVVTRSNAVTLSSALLKNV